MFVPTVFLISMVDYERALGKCRLNLRGLECGRGIRASPELLRWNGCSTAEEIQSGKRGLSSNGTAYLKPSGKALNACEFFKARLFV
jgi:hypothetical protein